MEKLYELFCQTTGICTDSRKILKDSLFVCLKGQNFDGNHFAEEALRQGAKFVISDNADKCNEQTIYYVPDTLRFLQQLANFHRLKFNIPVIGITGTNGKTTSKELINAVLSAQYEVLCTEGNLNNHIGVPLTLLRLEKHHQIAVIEMGANKFHDIQELCEIANPTHGIITNIGKAHLEGFLSYEGVLKTKKELYDAIEVNKGKIVYNSDDSVLSGIIPNVAKISYGEGNENFVSGELLRLTPFVEMSWKCRDYVSPRLKTHLVGKYNFYNFLAAITFGVDFGVNYENINIALTSYVPTNNRSQVKRTDRNTLIMDCYNANPTSMRSALESFAQIDNPDKLIVIGDMLELGENAVVEHRGILQLVQDLNLDALYVGPLFSSVKENRFDGLFFENRDSAEEFLIQNPQFEKLILLKGSRGIGLEKLVEVL